MQRNDLAQQLEWVLAGDQAATHWLSDRILQNELTDNDIQMMIARTEMAMTQYNPNAINLRGFLYKNGKGSPVDYQAAIALYDWAIQFGHENAINNRAWMHYEGEGGPVDYQAAIALYDRVIQLGSPTALGMRAWMHYKGEGGPVDYQAAIVLYDRGVQLGNARAMYNRASMHYNGQGDPVNYSAALSLYLDALTNESSRSEVKNRSKDNITTIVNEHQADLSAQAIFKLLTAQCLPEEKIACCLKRKRDILVHIRCLPEEEQYEAVKNALDPSHQLGKLFHMTTFWRDPDPLRKGSVLNEVYEVFDRLNKKREQLVTTVSVPLIPSLEPVYNPVKQKTKPQESHRKAPVVNQARPISSSPFLFTKEMNNLPRVADLPALSAAQKPSEPVKRRIYGQ